MRRIPLIVALTALAFLLSACDPTTTANPAAGMCPPPVQFCNDTSTDPGDPADAAGGSIEPADAYLVGMALDELPDDVRIARIGDEQLPLTMDYVVGRRTAELDYDDEGVARVVLLTVEADHGTVTFPQ